MKQFLNLMLVLAAVACAPAMAGSTQHINRTIDTEKAPDISIENAAGEILIRGTNASKITIAAELSENAKSLEVEERKGEVSIYVVYEKKNSWHKGSRLELEVPRGSRISVQGISADIEVVDVVGELTLITISGDVTAHNHGGNFEARTTSGDIEIKGHGKNGTTTLQAVSGDIQIRNVMGSLAANTVSGDIDVLEGRLNALRLSVTSGDVQVQGVDLRDGKLTASSISGDVGISLRKSFSGRVEANTLNGDIDNCFGPKVERTSRYGPGRKLSFVHGDGKSWVSLSTINGDIDLCLE